MTAPLSAARRTEIESLRDGVGWIPSRLEEIMALRAAIRDLLAELRRREWQPIETAPKDGSPMLWFGRWKPFDSLKGGGWAVIIVRWSIIMSDGTGYQWITEGLSTPDTYNVEWSHWQSLPEPPSDG